MFVLRVAIRACTLVLQFRPAQARQNSNTNCAIHLGTQTRSFSVSGVITKSISKIAPWIICAGTRLWFQRTRHSGRQYSGASLLRGEISFLPGANQQRYMRRCRKYFALGARQGPYVSLFYFLSSYVQQTWPVFMASYDVQSQHQPAS